jgi:hypothetical protein
MTEIWKAIPGLDGFEVSNLGRVRKYIDGHKDIDGYLCISQGKRGLPKLPIHTAVATAFIGPRPHGAVVRHRNDDKTDNRPENLIYGTRRENYVDAVHNGKVDPHCPARKARLASVAHLGGRWWRGRRRNGLRGSAIS